MPRRRTIYVDEMKLLAAICRETKADIDSLKREAKQLEREHDKDRVYWKFEEACNLERIAKEIKELGIEYDLHAFTGRDLTPSERIRHQEAIRRLSDQGFVVLYGDRATRVLVTKKGWHAAEAKPEAAIALTNLSTNQ